MGASDSPTPSVQRRRLLAELLSARQAAGLKQEQVAAAMEWSLSKVIRIEKGAVRVTTNDLRALLRLYKIVEPSQVEELIVLARAARERSWWHAYRAILPDEVVQYIDYEAAASVMRSFQPLVIPGLLQTEEYARTVISQLANTPAPDRSDAQAKLVKIRIKRQELLDRADPPQLHFIVDEPVIRRFVGSRELMRRQILHLVEIASRPNVTVQVVPFTAGLTSGMDGSFVILEFPDTAGDHLVYLESTQGHFIKQHEEEMLFYREAFEQLQKMALKPDNSVAYLGKIADEWT